MTAEDSLRILAGALGLLTAWSLRHESKAGQGRRRQGLTLGFGVVLTHLAESGPMRVGALATALGIDSSTLTPRIKHLQAAGLITRQCDPSDRRAALLAITDEGRALVGELEQARAALLAERLGALSESDRAAAARILPKLAAVLTAERALPVASA